MKAVVLFLWREIEIFFNKKKNVKFRSLKRRYLWENKNSFEWTINEKKCFAFVSIVSSLSFENLTKRHTTAQGNLWWVGYNLLMPFERTILFYFKRQTRNYFFSVSCDCKHWQHFQPFSHLCRIKEIGCTDVAGLSI